MSTRMKIPFVFLTVSILLRVSPNEPIRQLIKGFIGLNSHLHFNPEPNAQIFRRPLKYRHIIWDMMCFERRD